jgi:hypothetical protein
MRIALLLLAFFSLTATASAQVSFTRSNTTGTSAIPDNQCFTGFGQKTITVADGCPPVKRLDNKGV